MDVQKLMDMEYAGNAENEVRKMGYWDEGKLSYSEGGKKLYNVEVSGHLVSYDYKIYEILADSEEEAEKIARSIARDEFEDIDEIVAECMDIE